MLIFKNLDLTLPREALRKEALAQAKAHLADNRNVIKAKLLENRDGRAAAIAISALTDEVIGALFTLITTKFYASDNPSDAQKIALVATGGYGRGLMAPHSDVDLLFLLPYKQTAWGEQIAESILYFLWDLGLKVGHATRTIDECIKQAKADNTIRTAMLESRLIWGDVPLFNAFKTRYENEVVKNTAKDFVQAKLRERDDRHLKHGGSRYMVEPNIKEGKGGLRDLHTLFWIGKYVYRVSSTAELVDKGVFSKAESIQFEKSEKFLWSVRCQLHFIANRPEERLSFDYQREIAARLGYHDRPGKPAVERFMRHYFLIAKHVGALTGIMVAQLEEQHEKPQPLFRRVLSQITKQSEGDFSVENNRINVADAQVFTRDPLNLLRIFTLAHERNLFIHPFSQHLIARQLKLITPDIRENGEANRLFRNLVTSRKNPENILRSMNETGVLGQFLPEFGKIFAMMQFSMYHHYTVDEHLIRAMGILHEIDQGGKGFILPHEKMRELSEESRNLLAMAVFLHDIAKGRPEDHSTAGAAVAFEICPRFGYTQSEVEMIAWLIEQHLIMSTISQTRDLGDRKTIETFAKITQNMERMKLLYILTVADIVAVGPGVYNGWKAQLLSTLYFETEPVITGGFSGLERKERVRLAQDELQLALGWTFDQFESYKSRHFAYYWLKFDLETQKHHAIFLTTSEDTSTVSRFDKKAGITHLTFLAPDHPRLLSIVAGACATAGANIFGASVYTTTDGYALDTISLNRGFEDDEDEKRRADRVASIIVKALKGEVLLKDTLAAAEEKASYTSKTKAFDITPDIKIDNNWSDRHTMIEVTGLDRSGLLHELTRAISDLSLNIASAHIVTYGEKAVDVFYVTDLMGGKITREDRQKMIREKLTGVLTSVTL
jgi:[protein-PII] uridylyltransferase